ncbi:MAG: polysulfide reductase NrfD [Acidobacteriota bacterium]|nr:polysulfide reductase NrfD [Acidobacteriota bacterium]
MPNYGFAIDLRKCIGCHACTIACKSEHEIPVGVNRCWVKTVEKGSFPDTKRFFLPVLCNQCDDAPCVSICPTNTLFKRRDGIVDFNSDSCIGCRACMAACPYDQIFIDPNTHTAEKCNFCANRVENKLQPACVSVCPTECRIFGDLDDPTTEVAQILQRESAIVRRPEKGTKPKIFYIGAEETAIQPEVATRPFMFKEGQVHLRPLGSPVEDREEPGAARVDYDVPHKQAWGLDMALYLLTKGIATGAMLVAAGLWFLGERGTVTQIAAPVVSLLFSLVTAVVLIIDLERPERFYYILVRPNWRSWMVWGAYFLTAHGAVSSLWLLAALTGYTGAIAWLAGPAFLIALAATSYTGFLFAQGLARDLWQGPHAAIDLIAQALVESSAVLLLASLFIDGSGPAARLLTLVLFGSLAAHIVFLLFENLLTTSPTRHHDLALQAIRRGPYARLFWGVALGAGGVLPLGLLAFGLAGASSAPVVALASLLALAGAFAWEYVWVDAGQCVPIS